jgi:hypothetical protein
LMHVVWGGMYLHFGVAVVEHLARAAEEGEHKIVPVAVVGLALEDDIGGPPEVRHEHPLVAGDGGAHLMDAEHIDGPAVQRVIRDAIGQVVQARGKDGVLRLPAHTHPRILKEGVLIGKACGREHDANAKAAVILTAKFTLKVNGLHGFILAVTG